MRPLPVAAGGDSVRVGRQGRTCTPAENHPHHPPPNGVTTGPYAGIIPAICANAIVSATSFIFVT